MLYPQFQKQQKRFCLALFVALIKLSVLAGTAQNVELRGHWIRYLKEVMKNCQFPTTSGLQLMRER